tara:strand:+ start:535 stop:1167 length:633 start_codon:yes stop_codon:yes gene_type:complete
MKIVISFLTFALTSMLVAVELPSSNLGKSIPTQSKPTITGSPPTPPTSLTDELDNNKLIDYKKLSEELQAENSTLNQTNKNLVSSNQELSSENSKLKSEISTTSNTLVSVKEERSRLFSKLQDVTNRASALSESNIELTAMVDSLSSKSDNIGSIFNGWVYDPELGWIFISPTSMPYFYISDVGWVYYELGSSPRRFYFFDEDRWQVMKD